MEVTKMLKKPRKRTQIGRRSTTRLRCRRRTSDRTLDSTRLTSRPSRVWTGHSTSRMRMRRVYIRIKWLEEERIMIRIALSGYRRIKSFRKWNPENKRMRGSLIRWINSMGQRIPKSKAFCQKKSQKKWSNKKSKPRFSKNSNCKKRLNSAQLLMRLSILILWMIMSHLITIMSQLKNLTIMLSIKSKRLVT